MSSLWRLEMLFCFSRLRLFSSLILQLSKTSCVISPIWKVLYNFFVGGIVFEILGVLMYGCLNIRISILFLYIISGIKQVALLKSITASPNDYNFAEWGDKLLITQYQWFYSDVDTRSINCKLISKQQFRENAICFEFHLSTFVCFNYNHQTIAFGISYKLSHLGDCLQKRMPLEIGSKETILARPHSRIRMGTNQSDDLRLKRLI